MRNKSELRKKLKEREVVKTKETTDGILNYLIGSKPYPTVEDLLQARKDGRIPEGGGIIEYLEYEAFHADGTIETIVKEQEAEQGVKEEHFKQHQREEKWKQQEWKKDHKK